MSLMNINKGKGDCFVKQLRKVKKSLVHTKQKDGLNLERKQKNGKKLPNLPLLKNYVD